jgi:hypothetical protein
MSVVAAFETTMDRTRVKLIQSQQEVGASSMPLLFVIVAESEV